MRIVTYEQVVELVKTLPPDKLASLYDFAGYLATRHEIGWLQATEAEMQAEDEVWKAAFTADPVKLTQLADQALEAYQAGKTTEITVQGDELEPSP